MVQIINIPIRSQHCCCRIWSIRVLGSISPQGGTSDTVWAEGFAGKDVMAVGPEKERHSLKSSPLTNALMTVHVPHILPNHQFHFMSALYYLT